MDFFEKIQCICQESLFFDINYHCKGEICINCANWYICWRNKPYFLFIIGFFVTLQCELVKVDLKSMDFY